MNFKKIAALALAATMRLCDLAHQDFLVQCKTVDDIFAAKDAGKIAWVPCIEGAQPIENEVDRIDILYGLGVRQLGVTYSESNALGSGLKEDCDGGLTKFGKACVERMRPLLLCICAPVSAAFCRASRALDAVRDTWSEISLMVAASSSTDAACSVAPSLRACAPTDTCSAPTETWSAARLICDSVSLSRARSF